MNGFALIFLAEYVRVIPLLPVDTFMAWTFIQFYIFMGPAISFYVAFTQNTNFGECLLGLLLYAGLILALYSV